MSEIMNEMNSTQETKGEKTFTQEDVNRIVQDRLAKERNKSSDGLSDREMELQKREFRLNNRQKLIDRGLSEDLMDALNCNDEKSFDRALGILDGLLKERGLAADDLKKREEKIAKIEELDSKKARFTQQSFRSSEPGEKDLIRKAMKIMR